MAIAFVQQVTVNGAVVSPLVMTGVSAGNFLAIMNSGMNVITGISDSTGDTWAHFFDSDSHSTDGRQTILWYAKNVSAGTHTLTITLNSGTATFAIMSEFSGVDKVNPLYGGAAVDNADFNMGQNYGPVLTVLNAGDAGFSGANPSSNSGVSVPWSNIGTSGLGGGQDNAYYVTSGTGTIQAIYGSVNSEANGAMMLAASGGSDPAIPTTPFLSFE